MPTFAITFVSYGLNVFYTNAFCVYLQLKCLWVWGSFWSLYGGMCVYASVCLGLGVMHFVCVCSEYFCIYTLTLSHRQRQKWVTVTAHLNKFGSRDTVPSYCRVHYIIILYQGSQLSHCSHKVHYLKN